MRFNPTIRPAFILLAGLLAAAAAGCGPKVLPVQGRVALADGKPPPAGTRLIFNPADGHARPASAVTDADGAFSVSHVTGAPGAEAGSYTILLAAPAGDQGSFFKVVPKAYYDGSGNLYAEVKEGMPPLELKLEKPRT